MDAENRKKTVVVAGDLIRDHYILRYQDVPQSYYEPFPNEIHQVFPGGAWFLWDMIGLTSADVAGKVSVQQLPAMEESRLAVSDAYTAWSMYPRSVNDAKTKAWRASEFLGCNRPPADGISGLPENDDRRPDVLALDDLAQGFRDHESWWPAAIGAEGKPRRIVLKTCYPYSNNALWRHLLGKYANLLTVVLPVSALRAGGARISETLSWDTLVDELRHEFTPDGSCWRDLGLCRRVIIAIGHGAVATFSRCEPNIGGRGAKGEPPEMERVVFDHACFERLIYHPSELEDTWTIGRPGTVFSGLSLLTAGAVRHALWRSFADSPLNGIPIDSSETPTDYRPLNTTLGRALAAKRHLHDVGGYLSAGQSSGPVPDALNAREAISEILQPKDKNEPAAAFAVAFCHQQFDRAKSRCNDQTVQAKKNACTRCSDESALLYNSTGYGADYVAAKAIEVVICGRDSALKNVPKANYGDFVTVDRDEIERINAIRNLIVNYQADAGDKLPLSIGVFGPPGSGKSFAIKELAKTLLGKDRDTTFNLSQFAGVDDLHEAFHQVRDASVKGQIPLVFWDEFDASREVDWIWLKEFLAPMQDAKFMSKGALHPFGKTIFVFAGGTRSSFEEFRDGFDPKNDKSKGRDFLSRLRGYLNVKGPNREVLVPTAGDQSPAGLCDPAYLIRRAMLLRSVIERFFPHLIDKSGHAAVSLAVINAFLRVESYQHGARSLEYIVKMSGLENKGCFTLSCLPSAHLLGLHVTADFLQWAQDFPFTEQVIHDVARATHEAWRGVQIAKGNTYDKPFEDLSREEQVNNYESAWRLDAKLRDAGVTVIRKPDNVKTFTLAACKSRLCVIEHEIWMRRKLVEGFEWAPRTNKLLRLHCDIAPLNDIPAAHREYDEAIVDAIPEALVKHSLGPL